MGRLAHHECWGAWMFPMTSHHLPDIGCSSIDIGLQQAGIGTNICSIWKDIDRRRIDWRVVDASSQHKLVAVDVVL
jgi:hypothetical protein